MPQLRGLTRARVPVLRRYAVLGGLALSMAWARTCLSSGDWPQILGPHRNGIANGEKINIDWPAAGPKVLWQHKLGGGFAGPAVTAGRVVVFHRVQDQEVVEALDAVTSRPIWKAAFPTRYRSQIVDDDGPRCVPLIYDGRVYLFGAAGNLHCVSLSDGKTRWSRAVYQEFDAPDGYFGAGSSPIVEDDKLLVNVGAGRREAGVVAFDLESGKTIWQATDELASYSAPTAATIDGVRHVIFVTRYHLISLDSGSGAVRFRVPFGARGPTVNAATPLVFDGHVFVTASYGVGALLARIGATDAKPVWQRDDVMSSQYPTSIYHAGHLFGIDGRQDIGTAALRCLDAKTVQVKWSEDGFGMATLTLADGKLLILKTDGELVVAKADVSRFRPLARARVFTSTTRALPALANGLFYGRDTDLLKCLDLRPQ